MPFTPEDFCRWDDRNGSGRSRLRLYEKNRNKDVPALKIATDINTWIKDAAEKELQIRKFS
jgi:hypothetical protein